MANKTSRNSIGLLKLITALTSTLVAITHTRLALFFTSIKEGGEHLKNF
jgi:hypothetical protein